MEINLRYQHQPGYIKFIQARLFYLSIIFITLYAATLSIAQLVRKQVAFFEIQAWEHWIGYLVWLMVFIAVTKIATRLSPNQDPYLIHLAYICTGWGLLMIWRLSPSLGLRQTIWFVIASAFFILILRFPRILNYLKKYPYLWLTFGLILTGLTLLPGLISHTDQPNLWLNFKGITLQPSEPLKLLFIVYLSAYFSNKVQIRSGSISVIVPTILIALIASLILIAQRDLGTASLILVIYTIMVYIATKDKMFLIGSLIIIIISFIAGYFLFDVIRLRITAWINPWLDPEGRSYQTIQALISQASGGIFGTGPGMGNPGLVPVASSDFIFSAIFEETGLLGAAGVILLLLLFSFRGYSSALQANNKFNALLAIGLSFWIFAQSILIIGGNIRMLPLTGVTLPFFSYGGSSLVVTLTATGILTTISGNSESVGLQIPSVGTYRKAVLPILLVSSLAAMLIIPIWSFIIKDQLTSRSDNLRRAINDRYIMRGELLDRNDNVIDGTGGVVGELFRTYRYPQLSATTGYTSLGYGQSGLEKILDPYLRGISSNTPFVLWWSNLLYSHPPVGSNVRLSIDLSMQKLSDDLLGENNGAILIMNAQTGELLAVTSHPWFDPSQLDSEWTNLITDTSSPLLDRAFSGKYPPGTIMGPFLLAKVIDDGVTLPVGSEDSLAYKNRMMNCVNISDLSGSDLAKTIQRGCPQSLINLGRLIGKNSLYNLYSLLGLYKYPDFLIPGPEISNPGLIDNIKNSVVGQESIHLTPLQMVLAASTISSGGEIPAPIIAISYQQTNGSWFLIQSENRKLQVFSKNAAFEVGKMLALADHPAWGVTGQALSSSTQTITWFMGGTNQDWQGIPVSIIVMLEKDDPYLAYKIGSSILQQVTTFE